MKTKIRKDSNIVFIDIEGHLDFNSVDNLKSFCSKNLKKEKVIFNLKSLDFVGSVGLSTFSETLEDIEKRNKLKICCASSEFEKILSNEGLIVYKTEQEAVSSFD